MTSRARERVVSLPIDRDFDCITRCQVKTIFPKQPLCSLQCELWRDRHNQVCAALSRKGKKT